MSPPPKVALIFGMGARTGIEIARSFAAQGYKIAGVSRSGGKEGMSNEYEMVAADLSKPESVGKAFTQVKDRLGMPSVVVYNGTPMVAPSVISRLTKICSSRSPFSIDQWPGRSRVAAHRGHSHQYLFCVSSCTASGRMFCAAAATAVKDFHLHGKQTALGGNPPHVDQWHWQSGCREYDPLLVRGAQRQGL